MTPDACAECGSTTWTAAIVHDDGTRSCAACLVGLTALVRAGVPIVATLGELAPAEKKRGAP